MTSFHEPSFIVLGETANNVKLISAIVERQSAGSKDPREEYFGCPRPDYFKLVGYGAKFHTPRSTKEWMNELREGEEE